MLDAAGREALLSVPPGELAGDQLGDAVEATLADAAGRRLQWTIECSVAKP